MEWQPETGVDVDIDMDGDLGPTPAESAPRELTLAFTGDAAEFFRIWVVNLLLTLVTVGFYTPWARIRERRYLHANLHLDGEPFDYVAEPLPLLKGHVVVAAIVLLFFFGGGIEPMVPAIAMAVLAGMLPLLIQRSLRFFAHNTTWRNLRFRFLGTVGEAYRVYLLWPILAALTFGLLAPYWDMLRRRYSLGNLAYGQSRFTFEPDTRVFYRTYLKAAGVGLAVFVPLAAAAGLAFHLVGPALKDDPRLMWILAAVTYSVMLVTVLIVRTWIDVRITNHCLQVLRLEEGVAFHGTLEAAPRIWLQASGSLAILASAGLLFPWAKLRQLRYQIDHIQVAATAEPQDFVAAQGPEGDGLSDAATTFLDLDLGIGP